MPLTATFCPFFALHYGGADLKRKRISPKWRNPDPFSFYAVTIPDLIGNDGSFCVIVSNRQAVPSG